MEGTLPARFELLRELGSGGMGIVYEAFDHELSRRVAAKVFHDRGLDTADRIKREFRVAASVRHPGLVRLGELFEHDDSLCFTMELVEGQGVAGWIGPTPQRFAQVRTVVRHLASALAALHRAGVVHRDVKPSNIMVTAGERIVLLDLGLAVPIDRHEPELAGSVEYIAPEQLEGRPATTAIDLYGLGVVAFELLTGRPPFEGGALEVLVAKTQRDAPPVGADVPVDLARIVATLLARDPAVRPTASALAAMLDEPGTGPRRIRRASIRGDNRPLYGRTDELAALLAASDEPAADDRTTVFMLRGGAGVGKTALLDAFARAAIARGHLVCLGRCAPREHLQWNAWEALIDGLARHLLALPLAERDPLVPAEAEVLTRWFPTFARVVEAGGRRVDAVDAVDAVDELVAVGVRALRELLRRIGQTRRVISILDDAQWATPDSFALLVDVLAKPSPPCLVVFCVRTSTAQASDARARLAALRSLPIDLRFLELGPLPDDDAIALATHLTGDPVLGRELGLAAHGNPLFVEQLASEPDADGANVATLLRRRVASLTAEQAQVMRLVAAAGSPLRHDHLVAALDLALEPVAHALERLADRWLVRLTGLTRADTSEPFHELVVAATRATSADPALTDEHRALAGVLDDPAARVGHWLAAGDGERAASAAIAAVKAARDRIGFARAVALCDSARTLAAPIHGAELARRRADALAGAGAGERAAEAYAEAADAATGADALDLERLAAENFLRSGRVDDGLARAQRVASALGFELSTGAARAIGRVAMERMRNRWRGVELARTSSASEGQAADACYSLSTGLSMIDSVRAAWFTSRGVRHALASGDPARGARALGLEACLLASRGTRGSRRARDLLAQARALATRSGDRSVLALGEHAAGVVDLLLGDYRSARAHTDQAVALFKDGVAGVAFERHTAQFFGAVASFWLGEWSDAARRLRSLVRTADATGDRFARVCATTGVVVMADLVRGVPADYVRARIAQAAALWPREQAPSAFMRELSALAITDLFDGQPGAACERLEAAWPFLLRRRGFEVEQMKGTLLHLRALARVQLDRHDDALADARALREVAWMVGPAALVEACVAHACGRDAGPALDEAVAAAGAVGLAAIVCAARDRRARSWGGDAGAAEQLAARDVAARLGLGQPDLAFDLLAPWR